jgi:Bacteriocin-protection, YdeI or OmpD-Associated/Domain of unknown function (DU1801)
MGEDSFDVRVDAYINRAKPYAQPILEHLRELVHKGCPGVVETIKWSRPFFEYKGVILGNMSAFNAHCSFGFWGEEIGAVLREAGVVQDGGMGSLGKITAVKDLPPDKQMLGFLRQAAGFVDRGEYTSPIAARVEKKAAKHGVVKAEKPAVESPELMAALKKNKKAAAGFAALSPSCKKEYVEWVADAKRAETKEKRIATALEWIAEGKQRNWKYMAC